MDRRKQILELIRSFDRDFEASLEGLTIDEQLMVTTVFNKVIPIFKAQSKSYYEKFYSIFHQELLLPLRSKALVMVNKKLTDYFDQKSFKLVDLQNALNIETLDSDEQFLDDREYESYMQKIQNIINYKNLGLIVASQPEPRKQKKSEGISLKGTPLKRVGEEDDFMTIEECAELMGCSKVTIHKYKKEGLPFYKMGRIVKIKKSELLLFMKQHDKKVRKKK
jgi:excisionase family DNA binding protein